LFCATILINLLTYGRGATADTTVCSGRNVRRILVRGVNAPLPLEAKKNMLKM